MRGRNGQPEIAVRRFQEHDEVLLVQKHSTDGAEKLSGFWTYFLSGTDGICLSTDYEV